MKVQSFRSAALMSAAAIIAYASPSLAFEVQTQDENGLGDIVVTAQKRAESSQTIPVSVTAIGGESLARQGVVDLFQSVKQIPGVVFARAPDDGLGLTFRGLGTLARSHAFEQSVALFTDGVFNGKGRLYTTSMFDIDRMEFVKGTQSTLLGKNASLGAINVVFKQPGKEFAAEGRAGVEVEHGGYTMDLAVDLPVSDKISFRVAGHYNDFDGFVTNTVTGREGPVRKDLGLRVLMHADLTDTVRLSASYQYSNNRQFGTNFQLTGDLPAPLGEGDVDFTSSQFTTRTDTGDTEHRMHAHVGQAKLEVDVGDNLLTLQTSRITYGLNFLDDFDYSNQDTINFYRTEDYRQTAQEVRFQSPTGGTVEYMVGGFFMDSRWNALDDQEWLVPGIPSPVDIPGLGSLLFNGSYATQYDQKAKTYSGFASGSIKLGDAVRINGGVRYTRETKDGVMSRTSRAPYTFWNMAAVPPFGPTPLAHNANFFDGNISLQYNVARDMMVYASFGHGSKSGGYVETNTIAVAGRPVTADDVKAGAFIGDEYTKSYEVGLKSMLFDRKVRFNILGYYTDVKGFQDTVFTGGPLGFITSNGPARSKGFEIETAVKITSELEFNGSLSYVDATMVIQPIDATTLLPKVDGNGDPVLQRFRRSQAPKISFNAGVNYDRSLTEALDLHLGAGLQHRNRMYNLRQNLFPSDALTTVDLSAGIRASDHKWSLDVVAKNVGNSTSEEFGLPSPDPRYGAAFGSYVAAISPARTILITAGFKF